MCRKLIGVSQEAKYCEKTWKTENVIHDWRGQSAIVMVMDRVTQLSIT